MGSLRASRGRRGEARADSPAGKGQEAEPEEAQLETGHPVARGTLASPEGARASRNQGLPAFCSWAHVRFALLIPKHDLRRECALAEIVPEGLRELGFAGAERNFSLLDLGLHDLGLVAGRKLLPDALEDVHQGLAGRKEFGDV